MAPRLHMPPVTVRTRIVAALALVSALALLAAGVTSYLVERSRILDQVDQQLDSAVEALRAFAEAESWESSEQLLRVALQRIAPDDNTGALGIIEGEPALVPAVPMDVDLAAIDGLAPRVTAETAGSSVVIGTVVDRPVVLRYVAVPLAVGGTEQRTVFVLGYDLDAELAELDGATRTYLAASGVGILAVVGIGGLLAGRLLRPIRELRTVAERITASGRSERIPVTGNDDVSQLTDTVNRMLDRLDAASDAQRRLLDDVGHELKTPITIVRGHLELMDPADGDEVRATRQTSLLELDRMAGLVQDISDAAGLQRAESFHMVPTDVAELTSQIAATAASMGEVRVGTTAHAVAVLDGARITQAVLQLVQNALTHGAEPIVVASRVMGGEVQFLVQDHGAGVPDSAKRVIFERFQRAETGRGSAGSGLGLAIVQRIAAAHEGRAWVEDAPQGGAVFAIAVPQAAEEGEDGIDPDR